MGRNFYTATVGLIFLGIGILHGIRAYSGWEIIIAGWMVPLWVSWLVVLVAFLMALATIHHLN